MTVRRGNKMEEEEEEDEGNRQLTFDCLETKRKRGKKGEKKGVAKLNSAQQLLLLLLLF